MIGLPDYDLCDVGFFIMERGKARWTDLLNEFVENNSRKHITRQRLSDYLKALRKGDEPLIEKTIDSETDRPIYKVTEKGKKKIEKEYLKRKAKNVIDQLPREKVEEIIRAYAVFDELYSLYYSYIQKHGELHMMHWDPLSSNEQKPKIKELYNELVSIAKKHGVDPATVPIIQRVKDWIKWFEEIAEETYLDSVANELKDRF